MTPSDDDFIQFTSNDMTYTHMKKIHNAKVEGTIVTGIAKTFVRQGTNMQVIMYTVDFPISKVKKMLNDTMEKYDRVIKAVKAQKK